MSIEEESKIQEALVDRTKKRKAEDEIEIDLKSSVPLSKKQKRLLRRGKITLEELNKKFNIDPDSVEEFKKEKEGKELNEKEDDVDEQKTVKKEKKFGVWIGNLSFDTTKEDIIRFIIAKNKNSEDKVEISEEDIVRTHMPLAQNDGKKVRNKGFCYMDFKTKEQMEYVVTLSETHLNGRNLLIKDSKNFDGRPDKNDLVSMSKNPPSRILFVGNLSFDTTDDLLKRHFQHCGEIVKIRMATFQDSGKCKGFAFVDFKDEEGATKALKDKNCRKITQRPIRMEYGEDRSKRQVKKKPQEAQTKRFDLPTDNGSKRPERIETKSAEKPPARNFKKKNPHVDSNNRLKSSVALASAPRASAAIVPSTGKKVKFD
ncbi:hypothetical protein HG537_0H04080 [Torulaspora globosa]|uniref:RRM domain-containing protein n=1 Tax=Torulaspora globosa TaxID=48254 RepID=A0A7H9I164_9SACH|nr:hypothetical protein HG537_0H04080 [Torulaspora sp. CBS 2947]